MTASSRTHAHLPAQSTAAPAEPAPESGGSPSVPGPRTPVNRMRFVGRVGATALLTAAAVAGTSLSPALTADAEAAAPSVAGKALKIAASKKGKWYKYGAVGPNRFDCSGLVLYSFKKAGKKLPRTAQAQYNKVKHIAKKSRKPGDLVFFYSGSRSHGVYHVGIYAGKDKIWHAPRTGAKVRLEKIWTGKVAYGRA